MAYEKASTKPKGRHPHNALSSSKVRTITDPGMYADGNGLYLKVDDSGNRRWVQRVTVQGRRHNLGLGGWPVVSLADAREQAIGNLQMIRQGINPLVAKRHVDMPTFADAAQTVLDMNRASWVNDKTAYKWGRSFRMYANPVIGNLPVGEVTSADMLAILTPIWSTKHETATKARQHIGAVMDWAVAQGYREDNPAGPHLNRVLPKLPRTQAHHPALPYDEITAALTRIRGRPDVQPVTKLSLESLVFTATRSTEFRFATWKEVDWDTATWTIPAERMKGRKGRRREHRVPLSGHTLEILDEARYLDVNNGLVFPNPTTGNPLSDGTHRELMRRMDLRDRYGAYAVPHGFRSSFRDWGAEQTDAPEAVMEAALAHLKGDATEAAYARSDLFERRRVLMQQWADYLGS